jgi:hypothetical protein
MHHKLKRLFSKPFKNIRLNDKQKIVPAFDYHGKRYFMFEDIFSLPTVRGLMALDYYEELNMRCTKEYLKSFSDAAANILSNPHKIDLTSLGLLVRHLQERLDMIAMPDHVYKLASVVFFDDSENPYNYDRPYNIKKINSWKEDPEVLSFFLKTPLKDLIPYLDSAATVSQSYSAVQQMVNETHLKEVGRHSRQSLTIADM